MVRAVNILSAIKSDNRKLALWVIIALRWPSLARFLQDNLASIAYFQNKELKVSNMDIPKDIETQFKDDEIIKIIKYNKLGIIIDEDSIRNMIIGSI